jgi:hypothetical protein
VKSLPYTCRHRSCAWITYPLFIVFLTCLERRKAAKNRKMLFDVPDAFIRSLKERETFTSNLFQRQVRQMTLDSVKKE